MLSAHHRRILGRCNLLSIKVGYVRTIQNVVVDLVDHIRLGKSGISNHFALNARVPGGTLNESLGARTDGEEIDLGCGGLELHGVVCLCAYYRSERRILIIL